jgi:hypothetical protein
MSFDPLIASLTLAGSTMSSVASAWVLGCFVIYRKNQTTFRHALVLNLTIADFVNATTNVVSGSIYIRDQALHPGAACTANAWIEQFSVQATDFSILSISLATLLIILQRVRLSTFSSTRTILVCLSVWIMPLVTSTTATAMGAMSPVSGNWCWISRDRTDLRYGLTHGWRFAIIAVTICIYTYVWWFLSRHFRRMGSIAGSRSKFSRSSQRRNSRSYVNIDAETPNNFQLSKHSQNLPRITHTIDVESSTPHSLHPDNVAPWSSPQPSTSVDNTVSSSTGVAVSDHMRKRSEQAEKDVKRMLILNGYPIMYVLLWIPGIVNRIMEATGSQSYRALSILQVSTQLVGFANAMTYGLNQQWRPGK